MMQMYKLKLKLLLVSLVMGLMHVVYLYIGIVVGKPNLTTTLMPGWVDMVIYTLILITIPVAVLVLKMKAKSSMDDCKSGKKDHKGILKAVLISGFTTQIPTLISMILVFHGHTPDPLYISVTVGAVVIMLSIVPEIEYYVKEADGLLTRD